MSETGDAGGDRGEGDHLDGQPDPGVPGDLPPDPLGELGAEDEFYELPDEEFGGSDDGEPHTALPGRVEAWRRRSATGAILTGFALGLQEVFEPKRDEPAVIMETSGDPPKDLPVEADFEYGRPKQSVVNVRPWLLPGANPDSAASAGPGSDSLPASDDPREPDGPGTTGGDA